MKEKEIEELLIKNGASLVGFSDIKSSPIEEQPNLRYAITIAYKLSDAVLKTITDKAPTMMYFQHYRIVNTKLDLLALDCVRYIESLGYNAFPIASSQSKNTEKSTYSGVFQHKTGARLSGIGFIGKSGLLITKEYGSKVRMCTVLTDMEVVPQRPIIENGCGDCMICSKSCPAGAISGINYKENMPREDFFDAEKCSRHMKTYQDIGRGSVCGICIKACPYNKLK